MKSIRTATALAACAAVLLVASPAFAWTCKAKNARGATYTAVGVVRATVATRALAKCHADSAAQRTCVIVSCTLP